MNVNKCQLEVNEMSRKQTIQIPLDSCTSIILDVRVLRSPYSHNGDEHLVESIGESIIGRNITDSFALIVNFSKQVAVAVSKTYKWLSNLGKGEIEIRRIEAVHNKYLGLRIRGMDR